MEAVLDANVKGCIIERLNLHAKDWCKAWLFWFGFVTMSRHKSAGLRPVLCHVKLKPNQDVDDQLTSLPPLENKRTCLEVASCAWRTVATF